MSATTSIEWTDRTWNPVTGCTKVSAGCKNCYAEVFARRAWGDRRFTDVRQHPERLRQPLSWRDPKRVFVNSMSDLFHEAVPDEFLDQVFAVMAIASRHTFQVLTKRPARMREYFAARTPDKEPDRFPPWPRREMVAMQIEKLVGEETSSAYGRDWPLPNVWLGVSCEDQRAADERIPLLLQTPAAVRFLSCEPLLGPIALQSGDSSWLSCTGETVDDECCELHAVQGEHFRGVDWVIVGGESGPRARSCSIEWFRSIIAQCREARVACFVKQLGRRPCTEIRPEQVVSKEGGSLAVRGMYMSRIKPDGTLLDVGDPKGGNPAEWPEDLRVREFPR